MVLSPSARPSWANGMLQLSRSAVAMDAFALAPQVPSVELKMYELLSGSLSRAGFGNSLSCVYFPLSIAADATSSLNVDPGW